MRMPGWLLFDFRGSGSWPDHWPPVHYRREADRLIRFRLMPPDRAVNQLGTLHGGFLAGIAENNMGLFLAGEDGSPPQAVAVSLSLDYCAPGRPGEVLEGELELVRDTFRMQFVRIMLMQQGEPVLQASGILRKLKAAA